MLKESTVKPLVKRRGAEPDLAYVGDPYRHGTCEQVTAHLLLREQLPYCLDCSGLAPHGKCWLVSLRVARAFSVSAERSGREEPLSPVMRGGATTREVVAEAIAALERARA